MIHLSRLIRLLLCLVCTQASADFALRDGDTVAFLGDSITAARGYTKIVEHYTLMRYPARKVRFVNAGKGGDTMSSCLERIDRDVFAHGATVVTVVFGVNDIGWGMKADAEHKQRYLDGIRAVIERCKAHNVRAIICSPAITAELPDEAEGGFLQKMTDEGLALAKSLGAETIDLLRGMREVQRRVVAANAKEKDADKHTKLHVQDGVHINELGHLAMAFAMLKGLGAPEDVSSASIDAKAARVVSAFNYRWVPIPEGINRYLLTVENLPAGDYEIRVEGRSLGRVSAAELAHGVNISSRTADGWEPGGPWDAQSDMVKELVDARDKQWMSGFQRMHYLANHPQSAALEKDARKLDDDLTALQRATAKPYAYHFQIRRVAAAEKKP